MTTPEGRYVINNDPEGDVESVARKADALRLAERWAREDGITYYVYDRMARRGCQRPWKFPILDLHKRTPPESIAGPERGSVA